MFPCALAVLCLLAAPTAAQQAPPKTPASLTATLAQGWSALAAGDLKRARLSATAARKTAPHSAAALALAVEVDIVEAGPLQALDTYEQWMQSRKVEEPYVLRRVATAFLQAIVKQNAAGTARTDALKALVADGDPSALEGLSRGTVAGNAEDARVQAMLGDDRAVESMVAQLKTAPSKSTTIRALAESRSRLAIPPLMEILTTGRDDDRAAAATALAQLDAREAVSQIIPLLNQPNFVVRVAAASALYRLGDDSGLEFLNQMLASEHAAVKLGAAEALSVRPSGNWLETVRGLTSQGDEAVQLGAARLIAPYDPALAGEVLARLGQSDNIAVREEASRVQAEHVVSDFATLRQLLRSRDGSITVRAARRLLELVR